jgi:uncharacterized glyoxalase superfamily protein PhnB
MTKPSFIRAIPVLPSTDVAASVAFFRDKLGFETWAWDDPPSYAGVHIGPIEIHISSTDDPQVCKWASCRVDVTGVDALYERARKAGAVHPNSTLSEAPWGFREFAVLDPVGLCVTFGESTD